MPGPNPFTEVYDAIFGALVAHQPLADLVDISNRITHSGDTPARHVESLQPGDVPELELLPSNGTWDIFASSSSAQAVQAYLLKVVSGDLRLVKYNNVKWEVGRALAMAWDQDSFATDYIRNLRVTDFVDNLDPTEDSRGIQGWTGQLQIETEIWINKDCILGG